MLAGDAGFIQIALHQGTDVMFINSYKFDEVMGERKVALFETAQDIVSDVSGLVSLPEVCIKIGELNQDPNASAIQFGKLISQDAALTVRLLRIVNSAFYRFPSKIETVSRAVAIIGQRDLQNIVLAACVSSIFDRIKSQLVDIDHYWRHAVYTGIVARIVAQHNRVLHPERLFVAGLLHDIGRLLMCYRREADTRLAIAMSLSEDIQLYQAEERIFGFTHADVGAELLKNWNLPDSLQYTTRLHHAPAFSEYPLECAIVHLADQISHMAERGDFSEIELSKVPDFVWRLTSLQGRDIESLIVNARDQFIESLHLFRPSVVSKSGYHSTN